MKRVLQPFQDEGVTLRLLEEGDLAHTLAWRNRPEARKWFKNSDELDLPQHYGWFGRYKEKDDDFVFIIEAAGVPVGQAAVYGIDWAHGIAEVGRFLACPDYAGRGYINRGCKALLGVCSEILLLNYVFLEVKQDNERAIQIYRNNGFVMESRAENLLRMGLNLRQK